MDKEPCPLPNQNVFPQLLWQNQFYFTRLILKTSLHHFVELLKNHFQKSGQKWKTCCLISRQQSRLSWATSGRNSSKLTNDGSKWESSKWLKIWRRLWELELCLYWVLKDTKDQWINLPESLELFCDVILVLVLGFKSSKYDLQLVRSCWFFLLLKEPIVYRYWTHCLEKSEPVHRFQSLWLSTERFNIFLGRATSLDSFWKPT